MSVLLTALVIYGAAVHSTYCLITAFITAANKSKVSSPCHCDWCGAEFYVLIDQLLKSTQPYTKCIVRRRTPFWCT